MIVSLEHLGKTSLPISNYFSHFFWYPKEDLKDFWSIFVLVVKPNRISPRISTGHLVVQEVFSSFFIVYELQKKAKSAFL